MRIENKLIKALRSNDETIINHIFEEIYNEYAKLVYFCISKYVVNKMDVEELTNDVFINFFNHLENVEESKSIKYYLTTSAKNAAIDFLKKKKLNIVQFDELEVYSEEHLNGDTVYQQLLVELKAVLNDKEIKIILDHQIYGMQFKEIAETMKLSTNTIKSIYRRALKKFQKEYKGGLNNE